MAAQEGLDETRMSIGEHLEELRWHVLRAVLVVFALLLLALWQQNRLMRFATWPHRSVVKDLGDDRYFPGVEPDLKQKLLEAWEQNEALERELDATERNAAILRFRADPKRVEEAILKLEAEQDELSKKLARLAADLEAAVAVEPRDEKRETELLATRATLVEERSRLEKRYKAEVLPFFDERAKVPRIELTQLKYTEAFLSSLKLCLVVALFVGSPLVVRELWSFVAKGLYSHEKKYVRLFGPLSFVAFILGGTFGYFVLIPTGLRFLIAYGSAELVGATISLGDYLSLFVALTLVMGAIFELPLVMVFTTLLGLTNPDLFRKFRRHFILASFVLGAVLTPTPDPFTQLLMVGPLYGLYELGIRLSGLVGKGKAVPAEPSEPPPGPTKMLPDDPPPAAPPPTPKQRPSVKLKKPEAKSARLRAPPPATIPRGAELEEEPAAAPRNGGKSTEAVPILPVPSDTAPIRPSDSAVVEEDEVPIGGEADEPVPEPSLGDLGVQSDVGYVGGAEESGRFDPSLEDPEFERMGKNKPPPRDDEEPLGG